MNYRNLTTVVIGGLLFLSVVHASKADLGKEGTYSGQIGFVTEAEEVMALTKEHLFLVGKYTGTSTNSNGKGFLHNVAWTCGGTTEILGGEVSGVGYCTLTDQDGDQISGQWTCSNGDCDQYFNIGGTGKYEGLRSHNKFDLVFIGSTGHFVSELRDGKYTIP